MEALAEYLLFQISAKANCFDILYHHLKVVAIQKFKSDFPAFWGEAVMLHFHVVKNQVFERQLFFCFFDL